MAEEMVKDGYIKVEGILIPKFGTDDYDIVVQRFYDAVKLKYLH
jgi:hypothetical protein